MNDYKVNILNYKLKEYENSEDITLLEKCKNEISLMENFFKAVDEGKGNDCAPY